MKLLAIVGSPRKGKSTDNLIDKALEGVKSKKRDMEVKKLYLVDAHINYCRNCLSCRDSKEKGPVVSCTIRDDMDDISQDLVEADYLIFGTPLHMSYPTALLMTFLGRVCWTFAKPEKRVLTLSNCPMPRSEKKRRSITIIANAGVPPIYRNFCDNAAPLIKFMTRDSLNAVTVGDLYAGNIEKRGVEYYYDRAFKLGVKLVAG